MILCVHMTKKYKSQSVKVIPGVSIYKRQRSDQWYGYLRINNKVFRKCLETSDRKESEKLVLEWKQELILDPMSPVSEFETTFLHFSNKLVEREKSYPNTPSNLEPWKETNRLLNRTNGCNEFFGVRDIRSIKKSDVDEFIHQLSPNKKLGQSTVKKHLNVLRKTLNLSDTLVEFPRLNGNTKKSERRGYFSKEEYRKLRDESLKLVGMNWTERNGTIYQIDHDLHDFIVFMTSSMLRPTVGEIYSLQHKHIHQKTTEKGTNYLEFTLNRKNKQMTVQTLSTGFYCYEKLVDRRNQKRIDPEEYLFLPKYENRRHCMSVMSRMFNELLNEIGLKYGTNNEVRTLYSLRHTSIIFNLQHSDLDMFEVSKRGDTSIKMIEDYYYPESQMDEKLSKFLREEF
jgi:integrase